MIRGGSSRVSTMLPTKHLYILYGGVFAVNLIAIWLDYWTSEKLTSQLKSLKYANPITSEGQPQFLRTLSNPRSRQLDISKSCYHSNFNYDFQLHFVVQLVGLNIVVSRNGDDGLWSVSSALIFLKFSATDRLM